MDDLDRCTAARVERAMTRAGMHLCDLALQIHLPAPELDSKLRATTSFTIRELLTIAAALNSDPLDLLPECATAAPVKGCCCFGAVA